MRYVRYVRQVFCQCQGFLQENAGWGLEARETFCFFENLLYILQVKVMIRLHWYYTAFGIVLIKKEIGSFA